MPHDAGDAPRVTVGVVALGLNDRIGAAIDALRAHESTVTFDVVCVVNACDDEGAAREAVGRGVGLEVRRANLGYTGGLHVARSRASGEFMVWGQDDMSPLPGWLDALVAAADADPSVGLVGSRQVSRDGDVHPLNSGTTEQGRSSRTWPETPHPVTDPGAPSVQAGWVSGAGALTRVAAWDEVGGVDLGLWPINFVDLEYSLHVRAHGWRVLHAPSAALTHDKRGSTPTLLVGYTGGRNTQRIDARWRSVIDALGGDAARRVEHECAPWRGAEIAEIERRQLDEASLAYLPLFRHYADDARKLQEVIARLAADSVSIAALERSASWRVTAPMRALSRLVRRRARSGSLGDRPAN